MLGRIELSFRIVQNLVSGSDQVLDFCFNYSRVKDREQLCLDLGQRHLIDGVVAGMEMFMMSTCWASNNGRKSEEQPGWR